MQVANQASDVASVEVWVSKDDDEASYIMKYLWQDDSYTQRKEKEDKVGRPHGLRKGPARTTTRQPVVQASGANTMPANSSFT